MKNSNNTKKPLSSPPPPSKPSNNPAKDIKPTPIKTQAIRESGNLDHNKKY